MTPQIDRDRHLTDSLSTGLDATHSLALDLLIRHLHTTGERPHIPVLAPFTGTVLGNIPRMTVDDVIAAATRARAAQPAWATTRFADRRRILLRYHDLVLRHQPELLDLIQLETGKARRHAFEEIADTAIVARHYAVHAARYLRPERRRGAVPGLTSTTVHHHPLGLVGIIAPWNYPLSLAVTDAIPALIAGNAVILKPDEKTPFTALRALDLLLEAGLPPELFQIVTGYGPELGEPLIENVDYLSFTGSTATGRIVAQEAAARLIGASLELGGKNPMIVLADADLDAAVDGAVRGAFASAGQLCISIERLYLQRPIHDRFLERFVARTRALRLSAALDFTGEVGSLASADQLERVEAHLRDAVDKGATILTGGNRRPDLGPLFFEPTILAGVRPGMLAYDQETFGPIVAIYSFDDLDDVIARANSTRYGLNASIWTRDLRRARALATRLQAGTVNINDAYAATWASVDAPMGGFKDSGLGRRHGAEGILRYTESQTVAIQRGRALAPQSGEDPARFANWMSKALRVLRRVPGLR
jgi:succinate-semialdehyde dehydrogenase/glutarate-semialdehyde dehydrogenase